MSAADLTDIAIIESKAEAELTSMLARVGIKFADLTPRERVMWTAGYRSGYAQGARDGLEATVAVLS